MQVGPEGRQDLLLAADEWQEAYGRLEDQLGGPHLLAWRGSVRGGQQQTLANAYH